MGTSTQYCTKVTDQLPQLEVGPFQAMLDIWVSLHPGEVTHHGKLAFGRKGARQTR